MSGIQPPLRVIFNIRETAVYARVPQGGEMQHLSSPESLGLFSTLPPLSCDFRKTVNRPLVACLFSVTRVDGGCILSPVNLFHSASSLIDNLVLKTC